MLGILDSPLDDLATQPYCLVSPLLLADDDLSLHALCVVSRSRLVFSAALVAGEDASLFSLACASCLEWATYEVVASSHSVPFVDVLRFCHIPSVCCGWVVSPVVPFLHQIGEDELLIFVGQLDVVLQLICDVSLFSEESLCLV